MRDIYSGYNRLPIIGYLPPFLIPAAVGVFDSFNQVSPFGINADGTLPGDVQEHQLVFLTEVVELGTAAPNIERIRNYPDILQRISGFPAELGRLGCLRIEPAAVQWSMGVYLGLIVTAIIKSHQIIIIGLSPDGGGIIIIVNQFRMVGANTTGKNLFMSGIRLANGPEKTVADTVKSDPYRSGQAQ